MLLEETDTVVEDEIEFAETLELEEIVDAEARAKELEEAIDEEELAELEEAIGEEELTKLEEDGFVTCSPKVAPI